MINIFHKDGKWEVWMDTADGECDGVCIGTAEKLKDALAQAIAEITVTDATLNIYKSAENLKLAQPDALKLEPAPPVTAEPSPATPPPKDEIPF
jgi:hypothetical protein